MQVFKPNDSTAGNKVRDLRLPQKIVIDRRNVLRIFVLITTDVLAFALGWHILKILSIHHFGFFPEETSSEFYSLLISLLFLTIPILWICQAYERGAKSRKLSNVLRAVTFSYMALMPVELELYGAKYFFSMFLYLLTTLAIISTCRFAIFKTLFHLREKYFFWKIKVMLIGEKTDIAKCLLLLENRKDFQVNTYLDLSKFDNPDDVIDFLERAALKDIDEIIICSWDKIKDSKKFLWKIRSKGVYWRILKLDELIKPDNLEISQFEGVAALRISHPPIVGIDFLSKRVFDIIVSFILLLIFSLPMVAISLLIKIDSPGTIFYRQSRIGLKGKCFKLWKFRTMVKNATQLQKQLEAKNEISGGVLFKIKDDPRITKIGKYLRKYSLDELPQLFNVLRGEMSLVGPRPLPVRDVEKFAKEHYFRHEVLPGITGLWQISGRSDTDSENVFNLDFEYIRNWSLALDFKILLQTLFVVLKGQGAY